jgi:hypothetical protein
MSVRLTAVVLLTGFVFAAPAHAEFDLLNPEHFLDTHETETAALIVVDLAMFQGPVSSPSSGTDQPVSVTEAPNGDPVDLRSEPTAPVDLVSATPSEGHEEASLAPEFFLDHNQDETFAWIAADLASAQELTTGTIASESTGTATPLVHQPISQSLSGDAPPFEEYMLPYIQ